jgi:hypothetical protein
MGGWERKECEVSRDTRKSHQHENAKQMDGKKAINLIELVEASVPLPAL